MTDPKPATPASDSEIASIRKHTADIESRGYSHELQAVGPRPGRMRSATLHRLLARIAADAETIKAQAEEIEALKSGMLAANRSAESAREDTRGMLERIEACSGEPAMLRASLFTARAELATLRAQVETLREALEIARKIIYTKTWDTDQHALDAMAAALAATEPKG